MTRWAWLVLLPVAAFAQTGSAERGQQLFRMQCAVPYCHGPDGTAGRAPQLIGHTHSLNSMFKTISWGIPGTGMPEFTTRLKTEEMADIVAYVMTLRGTGPATAPPAPPRIPTPEAKEGRALFFDSNRIASCGSCHELDGWGQAVSPEISSALELRRAPESRVRTARPAGGEAPFPAILVEQTETRLRVYDLTGPLPVLRTFAAGQVSMSPGSSWSHEQATRNYSDAELSKIAVFLQWLAPDAPVR